MTDKIGQMTDWEEAADDWDPARFNKRLRKAGGPVQVIFAPGSYPGTRHTFSHVTSPQRMMWTYDPATRRSELLTENYWPSTSGNADSVEPAGP